ncbi:MAG: response regulator [Planctomycetaceae bacterium]|nr:response regulator [Planctomycetaceae bacterium]
MPKIIVSLANAEDQENICSALRLKRHSVKALPPATPEENPKAVAQRMVDEKAQVAIVDYLVEDAFSVKMLQAATDHARIPRFIFVLPEDAPLSHVLMAVNEGASAILQRPVNLESLDNYIERAINGPSRFRYELDMENTRAEEIAEMEHEFKVMKMQMASTRKLISFLMSTPLSAQHRTALVVSDSNYQQDYLKKPLEDHGFMVHLATNPDEGTRVALAEKPRIVISDLEMEGKNGIEFCHDLKITQKFMPCFFVICTANSEKVDTVMAPGNGVDACVIKPSNESGNQELIATAAMGLLL